MNFDDFHPKIGWDSDEDDILNDLYKPALQRTVLYQRLAGYFSSTTFAVAFKETIDFIKRGGRMQLVTSAELSYEDIKIIEQSVENHEKILSEKLLEKLQTDSTSEKIRNKCRSIFGYMLSNTVEGKPQLEMKIAMPQTKSGKISWNSIYHQKVGIMKDENDNVIAFAGSVNETGKAWVHNIEDFKLFKTIGNNPDPIHKECVKIDQDKFDKFWNKKAKRTSIYDLPEAVKEHFLNARSKTQKEFEEDVKELEQILEEEAPITRELNPWECQKQALEKIKEANYHGILKMATGTGKTVCAFLILEKFFEDAKKSGNRVMILVPSGRDLVGGQWERFFVNMRGPLDQVYLVSSEMSSQTRRDLTHVWKHGIESNGNLFVIITIGSVKGFPFNEKIPDIVIGDEVHEYGTESRADLLKKNFEQVKFRIGLSATPERFFDPEGTQRIFDFFGPIVFTYCLKEAQKEEKNPGRETVLSNYFYDLHLTYLTESEETRVKELTKRIGRNVAIENDQNSSERESDFGSQIDRLLFERANILKTAENKLVELRNILQNHQVIKNCLVYCEDIEQLEQVATVFEDMGIDYVKYHYEIGERKQSMSLFKTHQRDFILSIKCLDQGLDIPECQSLILLASSTNPREYIQRRGRVLRNFLNKPDVNIYDIPTFPQNQDDGYEGMVRARLLQIWEFIHGSMSSEAKGKIIPIRNQYGISVDELTRQIESWCKSD